MKRGRRRSTFTDGGGGVGFAGEYEYEGAGAPLARRRSQEEELEHVAEQLRLGTAQAVANQDDRSVSSFLSVKPTTRSRRGAVYIEKPKALPVSSYLTVFATLLHYMILVFLFMGGSFYNDNPPPVMLFVIPSFAVGALTIVGILCLVLQGNIVVRKLCEPSTGMKMSILGVFGCGAFSVIVWAPLRNDYTQAIIFFEIGGGMTLYYLLVRRRLAFASIAFAQGAKAVSRLKALWFRVALHAIVLLVYSVGWSIIYLQLVRVVVIAGSGGNSAGGNSTTASPSAVPNVEFAGLAPGASLIPSFISTQIRDGTVRTAARAWMFYNLLVVSQFIKGSVWLSVAASVASISDAAENGTPVKLSTSGQMNTRLGESLPSLAVSGHLTLLAAFFRMIAEALRRFSKRRSGVIYSVGSLLHVATRPFVSRVNLIGLCDMATSKRSIATASRYVWHELEMVGMHSVVNDDVVFGARICSSLLFAAASSLAGRLLVEIFRFPEQISEEIGIMCFVMSFLIGNLGIEAGEAWCISLHLQFARGPEALYVANPPFANALHSVLFGLKVRNKKKKNIDAKRSEVEDESKDHSGMGRTDGSVTSVSRAHSRSGHGIPLCRTQSQTSRHDRQKSTKKIADVDDGQLSDVSERFIGSAQKTRFGSFPEQTKQEGSS